MKNTVQMQGPCGMTVVLIEQKASYEARGFIAITDMKISAEPESELKSETIHKPMVAEMHVFKGNNTVKPEPKIRKKTRKSRKPLINTKQTF